MADRLSQLSDPQLEQALRELGAEVAYPPAPDLRQAVRRRLSQQPAPRPRFWWWTGSLAPRRALAVAMAALLALMGVVLAVSPEARGALAERLGLRGVSIFQVPEIATPTPPPTPSPSATPIPTTPTTGEPRAQAALTPTTVSVATATPAPTPAAPGARLGLGTRRTLEEARQAVGYAVLVPTLPELGAPDEVYLSAAPAGQQVSQVFYPRAGLPESRIRGVGLLVCQFQADLETRFIQKSLGRETRLERVTVNGELGFWIEGQPHQFFYLDRDGEVREESLRLAGNTLLWEQGELTLRIEGAISKAEAMRIAASLR